MNKSTNRSQDTESRKPEPEEQEGAEASSGNPRKGGPTDVPGTSGNTGTIKVTG